MSKKSVGTFRFCQRCYFRVNKHKFCPTCGYHKIMTLAAQNNQQRTDSVVTEAAFAAPGRNIDRSGIRQALSAARKWISERARSRLAAFQREKDLPDHPAG